MHASLVVAWAVASSGCDPWYAFQICWPLGLAGVRLLNAPRCGSFGPFHSVNSLPACLPGAVFACGAPWHWALEQVAAPSKFDFVPASRAATGPLCGSLA